MREYENQLTALGRSKAPQFSYQGCLWLNRPFDIRAQIVLPMERFVCLYYICFINMYSNVP